MLPSTIYLESASRIYCKPLLPVYDAYSDKNTARPLWGARSMFDKEYLHVDVLADDDVIFEKTADDVLNMNTYTCHICDVQVPKSYKIKHNDGEKHKTCMKIADLALERIRKHMHQNIKESSLSIQVAETYFCEPCAIIVQNVNKTHHESLEKHLKSLKHDGVFKDFLMIYEDKDNINILAEKNCTCESNPLKELDELETENDDFNNISNYKILSEPIIETPKVKAEQTQNEFELELKNLSENVNSPELLTDNSDDDLDKKIYQVSEFLKNYVTENLTNPVTKAEKNDDTQASKSNVTKNLTNLVTNLEKNDNSQKAGTPPVNFSPVTKAQKKEYLQKASTQLVNYIKTVTAKCSTEPIHSIEVLTDKLILITAINGDKIKVPLINFHSIHNQKDKAYCKICEDPNVGYSHENSEDHMEKVMIPIEDKNAIRKIDDIWSHCVLCNDLTKNINFHLQSLLHRNKLKHCLIDSGTDINENTLHKPNMHKEDSSRLIQEHSLIVSHNDSEITCNICDITILNKISSIKTHIKVFDHITKYNATIEKNRLTELDDLQYYCMPCDLCVDKCYALGHCNGKKHNKHLTDLINKETASEMNGEDCTQIILPSISQQIKRHNKHGRLNTDLDLICFVCNIVLYSVEKHMNSLDHKKNYLSYLERNKLNEIEEDTFYCIPCNTVILIDYLMSHCTSKKHKTHLKNFMSNAEKQDFQSQSTGQLIVENSHINRSITQSVANASTKSVPPATFQNSIFDKAIPMKFLYQYRELSSTRNLLCIICDEEIPYMKFDVQSHVNMIDHVVAFNLMMLWNKIKRLNDKYYCDVCKVDVTYFNELSHITSSSHVAVMANQPKATVYEYDRTLLTLEYAMSHKVGDRVRPSSLISVTKPSLNLN